MRSYIDEIKFYRLRSFVENSTFCKEGFLVEQGSNLRRTSLLRRSGDGSAYMVNGRIDQSLFWSSLPDLGHGAPRIWPLRPRLRWDALEPFLRSRSVLLIDGSTHSHFAALDWIWQVKWGQPPSADETIADVFERHYGARRLEEARIAAGAANA